MTGRCGRATISVMTTAPGAARRRRVAAVPRRFSARRAPLPAPTPAERHPPPRPDLDALGVRWRSALDAAEDALGTARACGASRLGDAELRLRGSRLAEERQTIARLLDALASESHVRLRRSLTAPRATNRMLGLPAGTRACLFGLDGVLTASAGVHAAAWAETFDALLSRRARHAGEAFAHFVRPFDPQSDYFAHLHGRPRLEGVREFLASRGISLADGRPDDDAGAETVHGLANRKNEVLQRLLERHGVRAFESGRRYLEAAQEAGLRCAVVSASGNAGEILQRSGLAPLVDERVDGDVVRRERLRARPAPDMVLAACRLLHVRPEDAAAFETTRDGIATARAAGVGLVVAVDRAGRADALREAGAGIVVGDLTELLDPALAA
jgi:beta-phosphoglucomutase-like phosphatase (HAD superfamily)